MDFLDAPGRLTSFLEGRAMRAFIRPTGLGMKLFSRGASPFLAALRRVTGVDLLGDLTTFFGLLGDMTDDFSERAAQVQRLLRAPTTAFVLVTSAQATAIDEAIWFRRSLGEGGLPFAGVIVNRVHHDLLADGDLRSVRAELAGTLGDDLAARVAENLADYHVLARRDARGLQRLRDHLSDGATADPMILVPYLDDDVHDIEGLLRVHRFLFADAAQREAMIAAAVS